MSTTTPLKRDSDWTTTQLETAYDTLCKYYEERKKLYDDTMRLCEKMHKERVGASAAIKSLHDEQKAYLRTLFRDLRDIMEQMKDIIGDTDGGDPSTQGDAPADVGHEDGQGTT